MIITCKKCSTSFTLDDSLVKKDGSKVRCSVCKDIFTAYPVEIEPVNTESEPEFDQTPEPVIEELSDSEMELELEPGLEPELEIEDNDFSMEDSQEEPDPDEVDSQVDDDFSFEESEFDINDDSDSPELDLEGNDIDFNDLEDEPFSLEMEDSQSNDLKMEDDIESQDIELEDNDIDFEEESFQFDDDEAEDDQADDDFDGIEFEPLSDDESINDDFIEDKPVIDEIEEPKGLDDSDDIDEQPSLIMEEELQSEDIELEIEDDGSNQDAVLEEDEFELEFDVDEEDGMETTGHEIDPDEDIELEEEPSVITPEDDFSEYDDVLDQETEPVEDDSEEETIEIEITPEEETPVVEKTDPPVVEKTDPAVVRKKRAKKKKSSVSAPILILFLILLLVCGAWVASIMTGFNVPYISDIKIPIVEQYLKKTAPEVIESKPVPNQKSVNGRFVTNSTAGTLFVITGRVENPSNISYSHIEISGALITKNKVEAKTKSAFCGNIITEEMLKTGDMSDINKRISVKEGAHNSNVNIKPGASVPFMVVFSDLPDKLQNFTVKVSGFDKAN